MSLLFTESRSLVWELGLPAILLPGKSASSVLAPFSQVRLPCSPEHYCRMATGQGISLSTDLCSFQSLHNSLLYYIKTGHFTVTHVAKSISHVSISSLEAFIFLIKLKMILMKHQYIYISSSNQQALHRYLEISLKPYFKYQLHLDSLR